MDAALGAILALGDKSKGTAAVNLIQVYFSNIERNPQNAKFRKIRIGNPKFSSTIWEVEPARTFLLLCGFEQQGEFLVLPEKADISAAKLLIDGSLSNAVKQKSPGADQPSHNAPQLDEQSSTLKLSAPKGASVFDQNAKADLTLLSYMVEMGYDRCISEKALIATKNTGVQPAMDWISMNPDVALGNATNSSAIETGLSAIAPNTSGAVAAPVATGVSASDMRPAPVSRYQKTADERHKFQEKLRLEAIEAARIEKLAKQQHKQNLLKELQVDKDRAKLLKTPIQSTEEHSTAEPGETRNTVQQCTPDEPGVEDGVELRLRLPSGQSTGLKLSFDSTIQEIYRHVCRATDMRNGEFVVMTSYPQMELSDMEMTLQATGLTSRAALLVQRKDQLGVVTEGHGQVCMVKSIQSIEDWQRLSAEATDRLVVVEFYASWCADCRSIADRYESLNAQYGIDQRVIFARVDVEQMKVLKHQQRISTLPNFKLFWNEKVSVGPPEENRK
ncbi:uncharacterized protein LOC116601481 isoform X2 [Nematostella vectensis]|uniref:uncharacterized protein LOC116601481 isoform X2 n=1 Tax=Nematostella vectensis TaxID=45351 RepID=UPI0013906BA9|nr:uncharacterized protein LOC116601481 isoform X2 [Nematostella vectensis]